MLCFLFRGYSPAGRYSVGPSIPNSRSLSLDFNIRQPRKLIHPPHSLAIRNVTSTWSTFLTAMCSFLLLLQGFVGSVFLGEHVRCVMGSRHSSASTVPAMPWIFSMGVLRGAILWVFIASLRSHTPVADQFQGKRSNNGYQNGWFWRERDRGMEVGSFFLNINSK